MTSNKIKIVLMAWLVDGLALAGYCLYRLTHGGF